MPRTKKSTAAPAPSFSVGKSIIPSYKDVRSTSIPEEFYAKVRKNSLEYIVGHFHMTGNNLRAAYMLCTDVARTNLDALLTASTVTEGVIEFNDDKTLSAWVHWVAMLEICKDPSAKTEEIMTIYTA
jgi:hypothetical protein